MARRVYLHGGPWHGRVIMVPEDHDHFHIIEPVEDQVTFSEEEQIILIENVKIREGTYSQVRGEPRAFEWDGWVSHA